MKYILKFLAITIFSLFLLPGCKKDKTQNNTPPPPPPFQSYIKFKLDNVQTECTAFITATYIPSNPDTAININGSWNTGAMRLEVSGNHQLLTPGTYTFNSGKWHSGTIWTTNPGMKYVAGMDLYPLNNIYSGSGSITITEISTQYVKGTFEFITGIDIPTNTFKTVINGEFYIKRS